jgi:hypothetical protein
MWFTMNSKISVLIAVVGLAVVLTLSGGSLSIQSASADSNQVGSHNHVNTGGGDFTQCNGSLTSSSCTGDVDNSVTNTGGGGTTNPPPCGHGQQPPCP